MSQSTISTRSSPSDVDGQPGGHGDVVEQAEAHRVVDHRVVARRADQAQALGVFAADQPLDGVAHAAGRHQGHVVAGRADDRVGLDVAAARLGKGPNLVDVGGRMHPGEPLPGDGLKSGVLALGGQARPLQPLGRCRIRSAHSGWLPVSWSRKQGEQ